MALEFENGRIILVGKNNRTKLACFKGVGGNIRIEFTSIPKTGCTDFDLESIQSLVRELKGMPDPVS